MKLTSPRLGFGLGADSASRVTWAAAPTAVGISFKFRLHIERPWVPANSVRDPVCRWRSNTAWSGSPCPSGYQLAPPFCVA